MKVRSRDKVAEFYRLFAGEDHVLILINADPDAVASAMAVKRLLWRRVANITISHVNVVKRPDNVAMIRLLGVKMVHVDDINASRYTRVVMVDSQPAHHPAFAGFRVDAVIDHHPDTAHPAPFSDIRPRYGATASILTEYLRAAKIKPSAKLATALFHAIKTDTSNFERQTLLEDIRAFQFLFRHGNMHLARRMEQADLRLDFLKYFRIALEVMCMRRSRIFVHLGTVANPEVCVLIADFFMRVVTANWSIVSGICEDRLVLIFRNDGIRKDAGKLAKASFGQLGSAGGHKSMSRAEVPLEALGRLLDPSSDKAVSKWIIDRVEKKDRKRRTSSG